MIKTLAIKSPQINPSSVLGAGASNVQRSLSNDLPAINASYMEALHMTFPLAIVLGGTSTLVATAQPWLRMQVAGSAENTAIEKAKGDEKTDQIVSAV